MSALQPAPPDEVVALLARLAAAGIRLAPDGANVRYWSPAALPPELRELIVAHKPAISAALSIWCPKRSRLLRFEVDGLVAELGVDGTDPEVVAAAEQANAAHDARDMGAVRRACLAIERRARALAAQRGGPTGGPER